MANNEDKDHPGGGPGQGGDHGGGHDKPVSLFVNEKPVAVEDKKQTGLSIKQAAIAQNVPIQLDFVLSIERGGGKTELIRDDQEITVHDGDRFLASRSDEHGDGHDKSVSLFVNEKPVVVEGKKQTGLSIKQAAIAQNVPIQLDFVLSIERGGGKTELIGDDQKITVHNGDRFLAIPNDDNS